MDERERIIAAFERGRRRGHQMAEAEWRRDNYIAPPLIDAAKLGVLIAMVQRIIDNSRDLQAAQLLALSEQLLRAEAIARHRIEGMKD